MASESSPTGDKEFDEIVAYLGDDTAFHTQVNNALDDECPTIEESLPRDNRLDLVQPSNAAPLNDVATFLYERFHELCEEFGLDIHAPKPSDAPFRQVIDTISTEMASMSELLVAGDVVWASNTYAIELSMPDLKPKEAQAVPIEDVVVGCFLKPIIRPLPDDTTILRKSLGDMSPPPVSIGLVLERAVYIDSLGDIHSDVFESNVVIIPLGSPGLDLRLLDFRLDD